MPNSGAISCADEVFWGYGLGCLQPKSRARQDDQRAFDDPARERLKELIRLSPRVVGYDTSLWTLKLLAQVSYAEGLTQRVVHSDTISETLRSMGIGWKRAKQWIRSPDKRYEAKKSAAIG